MILPQCTAVRGMLVSAVCVYNMMVSTCRRIIDFETYLFTLHETDNFL